MSPFLADFDVIQMSSDTKGSADTMTKSDFQSKIDDAFKSFRLNVTQIKAEAKSAAATDKTSRVAKTGDGDEDTDSSADVTIHNGAKSIVVHHNKSNDEDMVFAAIPIVAIVFTFLYLIVRALMAPFNNRNKRAAQLPPGNSGGLTEEEIALMEKLQRTLTQMERRVESLETILIDSTRTKEKYDTKL